MSESLRDQLLKAGFKPSPKQSPKAKPHPHAHKPEPRQPREPGEPDLAQAFALRAKVERSEREAADREARAKAAEKKERKRKLQELLAGKAQNVADADQVRNFEYAGKIRRIYVSREQLAQINAGELGVVMHGGRALLVAGEVVLQAQAIAPEAAALLVDPDAPAEDDGIPDDLMW
ncbi:MAG: DUF2058 family protein [Proteobacteria bacterium]|nr:DUF2058 family protein [Pseudomonadota bacterium]